MQDNHINTNHVVVIVVVFMVSLAIMSCQDSSQINQTTPLTTELLDSHSQNINRELSVTPVVPTKTQTSDKQSKALFEYTEAVYLSRATEYKDAIAAYSHVLRIMPDFALAYYGRGVAYHEEEQFKKALEDFDNAIKSDPLLARAYKGRALTYLEIGDEENSITDLNMAISLYHSRRDALNIIEARILLDKLQE